MRNRGWLPPKCSHGATVIVESVPAGMLSRTIPEISDSSEDVAMQLLYWLWPSVDLSQLCAGQDGLQMFGQTKLCEKENAGCVKFYFVCGFYGDDIHIPSIFFRSLSSLCCSSPLLPFTDLNTVTSLARWVAKGAGCCSGDECSFPFLLSYSLACLPSCVNHK